jgi:chromosomal replication initiation ATPase DnaA
VTGGAQGRLFPFLMEDWSRAALVIGEANRAAIAQIDARPWPGGSLALIGPPGSGKSHIGAVFAAETGAARLRASANAAAAQAAFEAGKGFVLVDDAEDQPNDEGLFLLLNRARADGGAILLTGFNPPRMWAASSADLASRFKALPVAALAEPDEALLVGVLRGLCRQRFIQLTDDVARYLSFHMERSFAAAVRLADALDAVMVRGRLPVSRQTARLALIACGQGAALPEPDDDAP